VQALDAKEMEERFLGNGKKTARKKKRIQDKGTELNE